jgi:predicted DNA-binding transcriptional regulator AlpA
MSKSSRRGTLSDEEVLVDAQEMARRVGISRQTIWDLSKAGVIPTIVIGERALRFKPSAVLFALQNRPPVRKRWKQSSVDQMLATRRRKREERFAEAVRQAQENGQEAHSEA